MGEMPQNVQAGLDAFSTQMNGMHADVLAKTEQLDSGIAEIQELKTQLQGKIEEGEFSASNPEVARLQKELVERQIERKFLESSYTKASTRKFSEALERNFVSDLDGLRSRATATGPITESSHLGTDGKLCPQTINEFIICGCEAQGAPTLAKVTNIAMTECDMRMPFLNMPRRTLRKVEDCMTPEQCKGLNLSDRMLKTIPMGDCINIGKNFLMCNLMKDDAADFIIDYAVKGFYSDLNELSWLGDTAMTEADLPEGVDPSCLDFYRTKDGWLKMFSEDNDVNIVSTAAELSPEDVLCALFLGLPDCHKTNPNLCFFVSSDLACKYGVWFSKNCCGGSTIADQVRTGGIFNSNVMTYLGYPITVDPSLPANTAVLTPADNLWVGIQEDVGIVTDYVAKRRCLDVVIDARAGCDFACGDAIVWSDDVPELPTEV